MIGMPRWSCNGYGNCGRLACPHGNGPGALCPDEDERIEVVYMPRQEVASLIDRGELYDAKTLAAWLLFKRRGA